MAAKRPELRTCRWDLVFRNTIVNAADESVDMYTLYDDDHTAMVSLGVPQGRDDVAEFIFACIQAGQKLLKEMPAGMTFAPQNGSRATYRNAVKRWKDGA